MSRPNVLYTRGMWYDKEAGICLEVLRYEAVAELNRLVDYFYMTHWRVNGEPLLNYKGRHGNVLEHACEMRLPVLNDNGLPTQDWEVIEAGMAKYYELARKYKDALTESGDAG